MSEMRFLIDTYLDWVAREGIPVVEDFGLDLLAVGFGIGAAFVLDEFALSLHLRDVYWTPEGRHSIEASIIWALLGLMLLAGIAPFGIHDQTETPRIVSFAVVMVAIGLSVVTCLKGKLTLGLLSIFVPPLGRIAAGRLARPGSIWAQLFYDAEKLGWKVQVMERGPGANVPAFERRKVYDTTQPGRGNGGHTFGDELTEEQRRAVIEYLKTL